MEDAIKRAEICGSRSFPLDAHLSAVPCATQERSLVVVLQEPCDVSVPLAVAAALPPDALGRCALTAELVADLCKGAVALPWSEFGQAAMGNLWAWLEARFPQHDAAFADIAELDGAAAMRAAVLPEE